MCIVRVKINSFVYTLCDYSNCGEKISWTVWYISVAKHIIEYTRAACKKALFEKYLIGVGTWMRQVAKRIKPHQPLASFYYH
jgi:hypothetical protein